MGSPIPFDLFVLFPGTQRVSCPVDDCNDVDLAGSDMIDDAVRSLDYFTNLIHVVFGYPATGQRCIGDLLRAPREAVDHAKAYSGES